MSKEVNGKLTAEEAVRLTNETNRHILDLFAKDGGIQKIEKEIMNAIKGGCYFIQYTLGHNVHDSINRVVEKHFKELGYAFSVKSDGTKTNIIISWF